ncbi:glycosyltransferase family 4 protein [Candidatus Methylomirabilis sp.]|uniref:glycosyltransferase family 4 protein n=1 Tax=Candidatus Methylomirabilis sp. TaxID=2032687 RepID=UPI002A68A59D|nr:glycosyltransferase family 4 protein [Candidatus Methylomirabilis sp.]
MTVATLGARPKILFFAPILEYPPAGGPQISVVNAVKVLHQISELHIVTTVPIDRAEAEETARFFKAHSHALVQAPTSKLSVKGKILGRLLRLFRRLAAPILAKSDGRYVVQYANAYGIDIFWVDRVLEYAFAVFAELRRLRPAAMIVGDTCSVYSRFVLRELPLVSNPLRRLKIKIRGRKKLREEHILTALADVVTAVSELDAQYFRSIAPNPDRVKLFSNVIDLRDYAADEQQVVHPDRLSLLLLGSFGHQNSPMDRAAKWMAKEVMPLVLREVPSAHLYIIGRNADKTQANLRSDAITVVGQIPSVVPFLRQAAATLVPLRFESGTRFKILESGAASVPCISTALGAEGIGVTDKVNIIIADTAEEFAAAIVRVLRDPAYARLLGRRLHDLVAERYSLDTQKREGQSIIHFLKECSLVRTS